MSWKPSAKSSEHLRAKLDDEFETVAKPQGLRRSSDARRAAEPAAAPDEWQRTSEQRVRAGARQTRADREGARDDVRDDDGADSDRTGRDRKEGGAQADGGKPERKGPSLKMRAVGYLSRREHARRIGPQAGASCRRSGRDRGGAGRAGKGRLAVHRAFRAEPRASARVAPGAARIVQELRQHGVDDGQVAELRDQLRSTEHERALEVWRKRFGEKPADRAAYAKQARFLASRGFAQDVIRRILGGAGDEE